MQHRFPLGIEQHKRMAAAHVGGLIDQQHAPAGRHQHPPRPVGLGEHPVPDQLGWIVGHQPQLASDHRAPPAIHSADLQPVAPVFRSLHTPQGRPKHRISTASGRSHPFSRRQRLQDKSIRDGNHNQPQRPWGEHSCHGQRRLPRAPAAGLGGGADQVRSPRWRRRRRLQPKAAAAPSKGRGAGTLAKTKGLSRMMAIWEAVN